MKISLFACLFAVALAKKGKKDSIDKSWIKETSIIQILSYEYDNKSLIFL